MSSCKSVTRQGREGTRQRAALLVSYFLPLRIVDLDRSVFFHYGSNLPNVPDSNNLQVVGIDVFSRHSLDVVRRDSHHLSGIGIPVLRRETVDLSIDIITPQPLRPFER